MCTRKKQKAYAVAVRLAKAAILENQIIEPFNVVKATANARQASVMRHEAQQVIQTPAELFRKDKPKLDKRRYKKHLRKMGAHSAFIMIST